MAISYVGGQQGGRAGATSTSNITFSLSGGSNSTPQVGDLVVISITVGSTADRAVSVVTPTGYTSLTELYQNDTYDVNLGLSYKFMGSTPDTTFQLPSTGSANDAQRYTVHVYRGVDTNSPLDVASVTAGAINSRTVNPGAITPVTAGAWIHVVGAAAGATGGTYTAGYLTAFLAGTTADTNDASMGAGYYSGWTSGAYDPAAFGGGGTTTTDDSWAAYTIALRPASGGGSVGTSVANSGRYLSQAISATGTLTVAGWFRVEDITTSSDPTFFYFESTGSDPYWFGLNGGSPKVYAGSYSSSLTAPSVGDWVYAGFVLSGTTLTGYLSINNGASATVSLTVSAASIDTVMALQDTLLTDHMGAHVSHLRLWNVALSKAQLDTERNSATAVITSGLLSDSTLFDTTNYGSWTSNGTLTTGPLTPYLVAGANLVVQDATHGHTSDAVALTAQSTLVVADATHGHTADAVVLGIQTALVVADASHGHTAESPTLSANLLLAVADSNHGHTVEGVTLSLGASSISLTVQGADHGHSADSVVLTSQSVLQVNDSLHAHTAESLGLTLEIVVSVNDSAHEHRADSVVLRIDLDLDITDSLHGHSVDGDLVLELSAFLANKGRTFLVPSENRVLEVSEEDRVTSVWQEYRVAEIEPEQRIYKVAR